MNCCGNKRSTWQEQSKASANRTIEMATTSPVENQPRVFEYTGLSSRMIVGTFGKSYFFRFKGDRLEVDYQDSFAMLAEPDVVMIQKNKP